MIDCTCNCEVALFDFQIFTKYRHNQNLVEGFVIFTGINRTNTGMLPTVLHRYVSRFCFSFLIYISFCRISIEFCIRQV